MYDLLLTCYAFSKLSVVFQQLIHIHNRAALLVCHCGRPERRSDVDTPLTDMSSYACWVRPTILVDGWLACRSRYHINIRKLYVSMT
jgi:hypothetical protein